MELPFDKNKKLVDLSAGEFGNLITVALLHVQKKQIENIGENMATVMDSMMDNAPQMINKFQEIEKKLVE